jgi:hypothetical protein
MLQCCFKKPCASARKGRRKEGVLPAARKPYRTREICQTAAVKHFFGSADVSDANNLHQSILETSGLSKVPLFPRIWGSRINIPFLLKVTTFIFFASRVL